MWIEVILKFLNHLFTSFGNKTWLDFIPKQAEMMKFGGNLRTVHLPLVYNYPLLKLASWLQNVSSEHEECISTY